MSLIQVLWGLAILTVMAASALTTGDLSYRIGRFTMESAQAEAVAEAATARAVITILDRRHATDWRDGRLTGSFEFAGRSIRFSVQDELGRVDLNQADVPILEKVLRAGGLDARTASSLVEGIVAWRSGLGDSRTRRVDPDGSQLSFHPRNGPFQSVDELRLVAGVTDELYARVSPLLTVYSGRQLVDPSVATTDVKAALRLEATLAASLPRGAQIDPAVHLRQLQGRSFSIRMTIEHASSRLLRDVVVRITSDPDRPYWVLSLKQY